MRRGGSAIGPGWRDVDGRAESGPLASATFEGGDDAVSVHRVAPEA